MNRGGLALVNEAVSRFRVFRIAENRDVVAVKRVDRLEHRLQSLCIDRAHLV